MSHDKIKVLIVDDHLIVRRGLKALLETEEGIEVVGEAANGREAVERTADLLPDVVLMDLLMPVMSGIEAIDRIRSSHPETKTVVLTSYGGDQQLLSALRAGAVGYLLKDASPLELVQAIRNAHRGHSWIQPQLAGRQLRQISRQSTFTQQIEPLTSRELEVLRLVARGWSNERIGASLFISEATARTHVSHILGKLQLENRTEAALYALREGLVSLDEIDELGA